jgi:hypothetical protein
MVAAISLRLVLVSALVAAPLSAQAGARTEEQIQASYDAHQGDFDYLLGDWEFTAVSKQWGAMHGFWSAARLPQGAEILDEYRVVETAGDLPRVQHPPSVQRRARPVGAGDDGR